MNQLGRFSIPHGDFSGTRTKSFNGKPKATAGGGDAVAGAGDTVAFGLPLSIA